MPWAQALSFQLMLLVSAVGATCVAGGLLALECFASKQVARRAPGVVVALLVILAVGAVVLQSPWVAAGCAGLGALLLVAWPVHFEVARARIARVLRPKFVWTALLAAGLIASRVLSTSVLNSFDVQPPARELDLADVPVHETEALTDKGRAIALFHFKMYSTADEVEQFIKTNEKDRAQLIRLGAANPASNCHGWVFTSGRYGIRDPDVAGILSDNDYQEVTEPRQGDLAVYTRRGEICHLGLVRIAEKHAPVLVESKWGPFGVYLHAVAAQPFSPDCKFYRSIRDSHVLALRRSAGGGERLSLLMVGPTADPR